MTRIKRHPIHKEYGCDRQGNVYSSKNNKWGYLPDGKWKKLKQTPAIKGKYVSVRINGVTTLVHRFVSECWIPNPNNKPQVNHIDNNGRNNNLSNLEWVTNSENQKHRYGLGGHNNHKLTEEVMSEVQKLREDGMMWKDIAKIYNVGYGYLSAKYRGKL